jgi:hypothetical protein
MRCWTGLTACIATVMLAAARGDMIVCSRGLRAQVCGYAERATTIRLSEGRIQPLVCDLVWCSAYGKAVPRYACQYMKHGARSSSRAASLLRNILTEVRYYAHAVCSPAICCSSTMVIVCPPSAKSHIRHHPLLDLINAHGDDLVLEEFPDWIWCACMARASCKPSRQGSSAAANRP